MMDSDGEESLTGGPKTDGSPVVLGSELNLVDFWADDKRSSFFLTYQCTGSLGLLGLSVRSGRSRFWLLDRDKQLEAVALPAPARWGLLPPHLDPVRTAAQVRAHAHAVVAKFVRDGNFPTLGPPSACPGPSYNSPAV